MSQQKIKAIFFDIDGTLRSFKTKDIPKSNIEVLKTLKQKGIKIFIATGRAPHNIKFLKDLIPIDFDGYITLNGQICLDKNMNIISKNYISSDDIKNIVSYIQNNTVACDFTEIDKTYINIYNDRVKKLAEELGATQKFNVIDNINRALDNEIYQLTAFVTEGHEEHQLMSVTKNCKSARWADGFMDIIPINGGKDTGVDTLIAHFGIKLEETMAFGDGGNDIDMIKHVKIGVAMGNARYDVKEIANYTTDTVDNSGIKKALEHFNII